jgi:hypothetical protein
MEAVFISHEWWVRPSEGEVVDHPGANHVSLKLGVHSNAQPTLDIEVGGCGERQSQPDYPDGHEQAHLKYCVVRDGVSELLRRGVLDASKETMIWLDYYSVDQLDAENREDARNSVMHYVTQSRAMLIPTRQEGLICARCPEELEGYSSRTWCRCECILFGIASRLAAAAIASKKGQLDQQEAEAEGLLLYAASTSGTLAHLPTTSWSAALPASGELSVEADRAHIEEMQARALDACGRAKIRSVCKAAQKDKVMKRAAGCAVLGASMLCDEHLGALAERIQAGDLDAVRCIDLTHNLLSDAAIETLAAALKVHPLPKLEELNMQGNHVTVTGMRALAGVVGARCRLL